MKVFKTKKDAAIASFFMTPVEPFCDPAGIIFYVEQHIFTSISKVGNRNDNHFFELFYAILKNFFMRVQIYAFILIGTKMVAQICLWLPIFLHRKIATCFYFFGLD